MNIVKKLCPQERYNIKCPYLREPDRIVVHNTANDAPAAVLDWERAVEALDLPETVSACFLGAAVLELTGRGEESPWFSFLNAHHRQLPAERIQEIGRAHV